MEIVAFPTTLSVCVVQPCTYFQFITNLLAALHMRIVVRSALIIKIMEQIYYWIGLIVFWLSATIGSIIAIGFLIRIILDELGRRFKTLWRIVEFAYYRADFKEWVKDKERHPKCES